MNKSFLEGSTLHELAKNERDFSYDLKLSLHNNLFMEILKKCIFSKFQMCCWYFL